MTKRKKFPFALIEKVAQSGTVATLCMISSLLFVAANCEKHNSTHLQGTKWKLEGIVNEKAGVTQILDSEDCEECYTLMFDTETTASCITHTDVIRLDLSLLGKYFISDILRNPTDEIFVHALYSQNIEFYSVTKKELKFTNRKDGYYLTFKKL